MIRAAKFTVNFPKNTNNAGRIYITNFLCMTILRKSTQRREGNFHSQYDAEKRLNQKKPIETVAEL